MYCVCFLCGVLDKLLLFFFCFFFQAEDGIRDLVRSRGLGDVYKRQSQTYPNIEYLVIDGASSDRTLSIIEKYQSNIDQVLSLIHI